jgi:hypothetical protein
MDDELDRIWKKAVVAYFKAVFQHCPRGTEKRREKPLSRKLESWPRFEPSTSGIRVRNIIALAQFLSDTSLNSYVFKNTSSRYSTA